MEEGILATPFFKRLLKIVRNIEDKMLCVLIHARNQEKRI